MLCEKQKICCPLLTTLVSGAPIIQNGRIVGAVTHVFANDPPRKYGIFIENMLAEIEKARHRRAFCYTKMFRCAFLDKRTPFKYNDFTGE